MSRALSYAAVLAGGLMFSEAAPAEQSRWDGVWAVTEYAEEIIPADGRPVPLTPEAQAIYDEHRAAWRAGETAFDRTSVTCVTPGLPRLMMMPYPFEIMFRPRMMVMMYEWNGRYREIPFSNEEIEVPYPTFLGFPRAQLDGESIVIETVGIQDTTVLDQAGIPHSDDMRVTEQLRLGADGETMENRITFSDPQTFTRPWEVVVNYRRLHDRELKEDVCIDRIERGLPAIDRNFKP